MRKGRKHSGGQSTLVRVKKDMYELLRYKANLENMTIVATLDDLIAKGCKQLNPAKIGIREIQRKRKYDQELNPFCYEIKRLHKVPQIKTPQEEVDEWLKIWGTKPD